ncbi:MAG: DUF1697 domain-containing protein [Erysipelotrichaceae bacterium]|nr:DUF1697 domain-containing protein [Erysipelotrichaceae bacterium]
MEKYIALLRGINISGKNKISMKELKEELINLGFQSVFTYLNSGNVIFNSEIEDKNLLKSMIETMIRKKWNFDVPVFVMNQKELEDIFRNTPQWCRKDDKEIYDNIIFILPPVTLDEVYRELGCPNEYEKIEGHSNYIFWSYQLKNYRKSNWWHQTASTSIRQSLTIRTVNTMRKVLEICKQ